MGRHPVPTPAPESKRSANARRPRAPVTIVSLAPIAAPLRVPRNRNSLRADNRNMRGIKTRPVGQMRLPLAGSEDLGRRPQGGGPQAARAAVRAACHAAQDRPALSRAGDHPGAARAAVALAAAVRRAPARHRARLGRSLPGHPLLDSAGPRALHRRGGRAAPRARGMTAWRSAGAGGEPRAGPQGSRGRPLSRAGADHAATDADQHGLRPSQLPEAPPAPACIDPRSSGPHFSGWLRAPAPPVSSRPRRCRRPGWRAPGGAAPAGRCGSKNTRPHAQACPRPT